MWIHENESNEWHFRTLSLLLKSLRKFQRTSEKEAEVAPEGGKKLIKLWNANGENNGKKDETEMDLKILFLSLSLLQDRHENSFEWIKEKVCEYFWEGFKSCVVKAWIDMLKWQEKTF